MSKPVTPKISALCLVKNEERWIWFALNALLEHVDEIIVGDTGSTDRTVKAITSIQSQKIKFTQHGPVTKDSFAGVRSQQIAEAVGEWVLIVDGDEVWTPSQLAELTHALSHAGNELLVGTRFYNCIGDIYHYQDDRYSGYKRWGISGNITTRLFRKSHIPGLHMAGRMPLEGYFDAENRDICATLPREKVIILENRYLHMTYLTRANSLLGDWQIPYRRGKFLNVLGAHAMPKGFAYPPGFTASFPSFIRPPTKHAPPGYFSVFGALSQLALAGWKLKRNLGSI